MTGLCECGCGQATTVANRSDARKGWIKGQPLRWIIGHRHRSSPLEYIADENGCWIWQRAIRQSDGYGQTYVNGRARLAHRVFYERHRGPIAPGLVIDHLCRVPACVNPAHLEAVSQRTNILRGARSNPELRSAS